MFDSVLKNLEEVKKTKQKNSWSEKKQAERLSRNGTNGTGGPFCWSAQSVTGRIIFIRVLSGYHIYFLLLLFELCTKNKKTKNKKEEEKRRKKKRRESLNSEQAETDQTDNYADRQLS